MKPVHGEAGRDADAGVQAAGAEVERLRRELVDAAFDRYAAADELARTLTGQLAEAQAAVEAAASDYYVRRAESAGLSVEDEIIQICMEYGVTQTQLESPSRRPHLCEARHELEYRLRPNQGMLYKQIGLLLHRDHSTIIHGVRRAAMRRNGTGAII